MKKFISLLIFMSMFIGVELSARDMYISPSGSGSSYTKEKPGAIKAALSAAQPGDTIYCLNGTYQDTQATWQSAFNPARSGSSGSPIIIKSYNLHGAYFKRRNASVPAIGIYSRSNIVIDGVRADGIQFHGGNHGVIKNCEIINGFIQGGDVSLHWGINIQESDFCTVQNNYVHSFLDEGNHSHNGACIMIFGDSDNNIIEYNTVDGRYPNGNPKNVYNAYGTKAGGMDNNIWRYNFASNCIAGFMAMGNTAQTNYTQRNKIHNNIVINTTQFLEHHHGGVEWEIYNNTFFNGTHFIHGQYFADSSAFCPRDNYVWNNLIHTAADVFLREPNTVNWSRFIAYSNYNQVYNCSYYASYAWNSTKMSLSAFRSATGFDMNSFSSNPRFINPGGSNPADYKLTSYPSSGRGGAYASVVGAYITGNEKIGYNENGVSIPLPSNSTPPARPIGVKAIIGQ